MFTLSFAILAVLALTSLELQAQIPTNSIDYWIGNISPRCVIKVIYFNFTKDFTFNSTHDIPLMFIPLTHYNSVYKYAQLGTYYRQTPRRIYVKNHIFHNNSLRFQKAECYFSIIYYKFINTPTDDSDILADWVKFIANGFPTFRGHQTLDSNLTYCLILYHGTESNDTDYTFKTLMKYTMEMNLALIYLSLNSMSGYNVYCKTPSFKLEVAAKNVVNQDNSVVDQKFMTICSSQYTFVVLNEHNSIAIYDPLRSVIEHQVITHMLLKANISMKHEFPILPLNRALPRLIVWDSDLVLHPSSLFVMFDSSIRFFTCYSPPVLSFHFYVSAFESKVWISLVLCGILLATFMKFHIYYNLSKTLSFSTLLFYFSIFMEETYSIPSILGNDKVYRTATILWLLTAIVLTNTYISHVISGLNAPLTGTEIRNNDLYGNFSQHPNFSEHLHFLHHLQINLSLFFSGRLNSILEKIHLTQPRTTGYRIMSEPLKLQYPENVWLHIRNPFMYSAFYDNLVQIELCNAKFYPPNSLLCRTFINLMNTSNKYYPAAQTYKRFWTSSDYPRGAIEEELIKCQRSVYMERSNQLEFKYMSENYKRKRFYYLQDRFASTQISWGFYNLRKSKLPFYFDMVLQSGIYHQLHKLKLFRDHQKRRSVTSEIIDRTHKPEVLDMTSSVQTIFILFLTTSSLAKLAFFAECSYFTYKKFDYLYFKIKLAKLAVALKFKLSCT